MNLESLEVIHLTVRVPRIDWDYDLGLIRNTTTTTTTQYYNQGSYSFELLKNP